MRLPLHPATVHFPIALWAAAPVFDLVHLLTGREEFVEFGWMLAAAGLVMAVPAMATGLVDYFRVPDRGPAQTVVLWHMTLVIVAWCGFFAAVLLHRTGGSLQFWIALGVECASVLGVLVGAHLGGLLVFRHGIGQQKPGERENVEEG